MSTNNRSISASGPNTTQQKTYFEEQREILMTEIAQSLEQVLQSINRLNHSLEEVVQVGKEFAPVEALWSRFEEHMGGYNGVGGASGNVRGGGEQSEGGEGEGEGSE